MTKLLIQSVIMIVSCMACILISYHLDLEYAGIKFQYSLAWNIALWTGMYIASKDWK